jgi:hypothetical protein
MHDAGNIIDVDPPGYDVSGHEGMRLPAGESGEGSRSLML